MGGRARRTGVARGSRVNVVLGLDPGTRHFGWGIVAKNGTRLSHVAHGVCDVDKVGELGDRLVAIERALVEVIARYKPSQASIETLFFAKDASAAAKLGHARGVALLVCTRAGIESFEYAPARVKRTVAGAGRADKTQVAQMVRVVLGLPEAPRSDAADALAIAVTHLQGSPLLGANGPARGFSGRANAKPALQAILRGARSSNR
ncbi:MAG: crossover junction endodeoxyribonuclease RuvC [Labilithrix sp.]|nr:crossover junction endodeoxyribonuclease RuvC [Labilithrix sp.]MCW5812390.1 crossover junction endodeoxyribonuclease RuvC [Labilithrix sp.]